MEADLPSGGQKSGLALWARAALILWGLLLGAWVARVYFVNPPEKFHRNHDNVQYVVRLIEFRDLLGQGKLCPQWSANLRGGLGSPHWSYYQPGFFYVAALVPWQLPPQRALGLAVLAFAMMGYLGTYALVSRRFGWAAGVLAASALVVSPYACAEIYVRGDLTEFSAMMLVPLGLCGLAGWFDRGRMADILLLTLGTTGVIITHPCVAIFACSLLGLAAVWYACMTRNARRFAGAALAMGVGVALAAFYWMPVFMEMDLVQAGRAFVDAPGVPSYLQDFIDPVSRLAGPFDAENNWTILDKILVSLLGGCVVALPIGWRQMKADQRRLAGLCLIGVIAYVFIMLKPSAFIWKALPTLQKVQFPWRAMSVVTVLACTAAGSIAVWRHGRAAILAAALLAGMLVLTRQYTKYRLDGDPCPQNKADLLAGFFAPDAADEWMPCDATVLTPPHVPASPVAGPGCTVSDFDRQQGVLRCNVRANIASSVVLPHYYFARGWFATLDGKPIALGHDANGLMRVELPPQSHGTLQIIFAPTAARKTGLWISAAALAAGLALLALFAGRSRTPTIVDDHATVSADESPVEA